MRSSLAVLLTALLVAAPVRAAMEHDEYAWPDMGAFVRALIERVGEPIRIYRMELDRDGNVDLWLQDRERPERIDSYEYADAEVTGPIPVEIAQAGNVDAIEERLIDLDRIDFARLPSMLARARRELRLPQGEVARIELGLDGNDNPTWAMHLTDPTHGGTVEFDLRGRVLEVARE